MRIHLVQECAPHGRSAPSPLAGEGWGEGSTRAVPMTPPLSLTLPRKGGGNVLTNDDLPSRRLRRFQPESRLDRVAHDEFLDLAGHRHRKLVDELNIARDLVVGDLAVAESSDLVGSQRLAGTGADPGAKVFAVAIVGDADKLHVLDLGMAIQEFFDLARIEVL